jgi:hypothetical protein
MLAALTYASLLLGTGDEVGVVLQKGREPNIGLAEGACQADQSRGAKSDMTAGLHNWRDA